MNCPGCAECQSNGGMYILDTHNGNQNMNYNMNNMNVRDDMTEDELFEMENDSSEFSDTVSQSTSVNDIRGNMCNSGGCCNGAGCNYYQPIQYPPMPYPMPYPQPAPQPFYIQPPMPYSYPNPYAGGCMGGGCLNYRYTGDTKDQQDYDAGSWNDEMNVQDVQDNEYDDYVDYDDSDYADEEDQIFEESKEVNNNIDEVSTLALSH